MAKLVTIRINWCGSTREVIATAKLGVFAVHRAPQWAAWTVTHIPTGLSVGDFETEARAKTYMRFCHRLSTPVAKKFRSTDPTFLVKGSRVSPVLRRVRAAMLAKRDELASSLRERPGK